MKKSSFFLFGLMLVMSVFCSLPQAYASDYSEWARYKYPAVGGVFGMQSGDINGDGKEDVVAISIEGEENKMVAAPRSASSLTGSVTVTPQVFDPAIGTYLTFNNLLPEITGGMIAIRNDFGEIVWHGNYQGTTYQWNGRGWDGKSIPEGKYEYLVYSNATHELYAQGNFQIANVKDTSEGFAIRVLEFSSSGDGKCLDEIKFSNGIPMGVVVKDVDNDGKAEIVFSAITWKEYMQYENYSYYGYWSTDDNSESKIYVYGWNNGKLEREYESENLVPDEGLMFGLSVGDTDGNGKMEILTAITRLNEDNGSITASNIDQLGEYLDSKNYTDAQQLVHDGLIKGSLLKASLTKLEYVDGGGFSLSIKEDAGNGFIYRLTTGNLNTDANDELVGDVVDLNYTSLNTFLYDLGMEVAKQNDITGLANLSPQLMTQVVKESMSPIMELFQVKEIASTKPALMVASRMACMIGGAMLDKKKKAKLTASYPGERPWDYPWWINDVTTSDFSQKPFKYSISFPKFTAPLVDSKLRIYQQDFSFVDSPRVGYYSQKTLIQNGRIIVGALDTNPGKFKTFMDNLANSMILVKSTTTSRWINPWEGEWEGEREYPQTRKDVLPGSIPQIPDGFFVGKLLSFEASGNKNWEIKLPGVLGAHMAVRDLNGDGSPEIVVGVTKIDYTKVNILLSDLNVQYQGMLTAMKTSMIDEQLFVPSVPNVPSDMITGAVGIYNWNGGKIWGDEGLGLAIAGLDVLGQVNNKEEIAVGVIGKNNWSVVDNYISQWRLAVATHKTNMSTWKNGAFQTFIGTLTPKIVQYNTWVNAWIKNGRKHDDSWKPIDPEPPSITWPEFPQMPKITEPTPPSDEDIKNIIASKVRVYEYGNMSNPWVSGRTGHLLTSLAARNIDGTSADTSSLAWKEILAGEIDLGPLVDGNKPITTIHVFKSILIQGSGTIGGRVTNLQYQPINNVSITVCEDGTTTVIATATTNSDGRFSITQSMDVSKGYTIEATCSSYFTQSKKGVKLWPNQTTTVNFMLRGQGEVSGCVTGLLSNPIENATVKAKVFGIELASTTTTLNGSYILSELPEGKVNIWVSMLGYGTETVWGVPVITGSQTTGVDFKLISFGTGSLSGTVTDTLGNAIIAATVTIFVPIFGEKNATSLSGGGTVIKGTTNADGVYLIDNLKEGKYLMRVHAQGYAPSLGEGVWIYTGAQATKSVILKGFGFVSGRVTNETGTQGIANARVVAVIENDTIAGYSFEKAGTITDNDGNYTLNNLIEGTYTVRVNPTDVFLGSKTNGIKVNPGTTTQGVNFSLQSKAGNLPDLCFSNNSWDDIWWTPNYPAANTPVTLYARVYNKGAVGASNVVVSFYTSSWGIGRNWGEFASATVRYIPAGGVATVSVTTITPHQGQYNLEIYIDPPIWTSGKIEELNEHNNHAHKCIFVKRAFPGEEIEVMIPIENPMNSGEMDEWNLEPIIPDGWGTESIKLVNTRLQLLPGESVNISLKITPPIGIPSGIYSIPLTGISSLMGTVTVKVVILIAQREEVKDPTQPVRVRTNAGAGIEIPKNTLPAAGMNVIVNENPHTDDYKDADENMNEAKPIGGAVEFKVEDPMNPEQDMGTMTQPVKLSLPYPGTLSAETINQLRVYRLNPVTRKWEIASGTITVNAASNTIGIEVDHLSMYRLGEAMAPSILPPATSTEGITTYNCPNPFEQATKIFYYIPGSGQTGVTIKIYNIAGELVRTLTDTAGRGSWEDTDWNGKNDGNEAVSSGVYIYLIEAAGYKKAQKMAIIK